MSNETFQSIEQDVEALVVQGVQAYLQTQPEAPDIGAFQLESPRNPEHGDWATSVALRLAKPLRMNPFAIAEAIVEHIPASDLIEKPEIARPGFINVRLAGGAVARLIRYVLERGEKYGHSKAYDGQRVMVEFVSANPTGPLHIGHGRGAVIGDTLARILAAAGYKVHREYYYNDAGVQMKKLGETHCNKYIYEYGKRHPSDAIDYFKTFNVDRELGEGHYLGSYMTDIAEGTADQFPPEQFVSSEDPIKDFSDKAAEIIMGMIKEDLDRLGIHFDEYFSETTLHKDGNVEAALDKLKRLGKVYEQDGAWWLASAQYGDEKDRVVVKSDGDYTYLAPDIAYHENKFACGFDRLINVLGADHHGYVPRLRAAVEALGYRADRLDCVIVQLVAVERSGEAVKLSTRAGDFITLKEVLDEIGPDVTRFLFLTRAADSQMVFDFDLAKDTSMDNPVYYVQYAHARCCSLMRKAEETGQPWCEGRDADLGLLSVPEERVIVRQMDRLTGVVLEVAKQVEPMLMTAYLRDLATAFHSYYSQGNKDASLRVIQADSPALTQARLTLIATLRQTFANALEMLGVTPLERL